MKKKSRTTIIDETVIELNEKLDTVIERLMAQQGVCRNTDSQDMGLEFYCNKKGNISIFNNTSAKSDYFHRIYKVQGEVVEEDGKTRVKIYALHDRSTVAYRKFDIIVRILALLIYTLFLFLKSSPLTLRDFIPFPLVLILIISIFSRTKKEQQNKTYDIDIMKKEIINRVEAVKRWDD